MRNGPIELKKELPSDKLNLLYLTGKTKAIEYFNNTNKNYDLIFVDGDIRPDCVKNSFNKSDIIVVHDLGIRHFKNKKFGWNTIDVPDNYKVIVMLIEIPPTTVYTNNKNLFDILKKYKSFVVKE